MVVELNCTEVVAQPKIPPVAVTVGGVTSPVTVIEAVAVQILPPAETVVVSV